MQVLRLTEIVGSEEVVGNQGGAGNQEGAEEGAEEVHPLSLR